MSEQDPTNILLSEQQLAARWGLHPGTLSNQRARGEGCPYVRIGRTIRFRLSDVLAYEQTVTPAAQQSPVPL